MIKGTAVAPAKGKSNGKDEQPLETSSVAPAKADEEEEPAKTTSASRIAS